MSSLHHISRPSPLADPFAFDFPTAAYLHIPFCRRRCHYCDFATGRGTGELIETYVQSLCSQIGSIATPHSSSKTEEVLQTVFFGGGTPSLLTGEQLSRLLTVLRKQLQFSSTAEISLEANPGTINRQKLTDFRAAGVNRISLGAQAFQPELLEACGRLHGVEEVYQAVTDLRLAGFENFNLDLIFGLPHQTLDHWQESLQEVIRLAPPHVSLYDLTVESGTRFGRLYKPGSQPLPSDLDTVEMYKLAIALLSEAGYHHYEVSNFAKPGYECRHNRVYWENRSYYGLGMGATGYVEGRRYENPKTLAEYFQMVERHAMPTAERVSPQDRLVDTLMLGLRLSEGISIPELVAQFGQEAMDTILSTLQTYRERSWVEASGDRLRLLPPDGWLFSNSILVDLMAALSQETV